MLGLVKRYESYLWVEQPSHQERICNSATSKMLSLLDGSVINLNNFIMTSGMGIVQNILKRILGDKGFLTGAITSKKYDLDRGLSFKSGITVFKIGLLFLILKSNAYSATWYPHKDAAYKACQSELIEDDFDCLTYSHAPNRYVSYPSGRKLYYFLSCEPGFVGNSVNGNCEAVQPPPLACSSENPMIGNPVMVLNGEKVERLSLAKVLPGFDLQYIYRSMVGWWSLNIPRLQNIPSSNWKYVSTGSPYLYRFQLVEDTWMPVELNGKNRLYSSTENGQLFWHWINESKLEYVFNESGRLLKIKNSLGDVAFLDYSSPDSFTPVRIFTETGKNVALEFDAFDNLIQINDADKETIVDFLRAGLIASITYKDSPTSNANEYPSKKFNYSTESEQLLTGVEDESGVQYVSWEYDSQGRVIKNHIGSNGYYEFDYSMVDSESPYITVINPLKKESRYYFKTIHSSRRLVKVAGLPSSNCAAANKFYEYFENGTLKSKTDWKGNVTTYLRDQFGREISRTEAEGTPQARTISTEYHPEYNKPVKIIEPGLITEIQYDGNGRLQSSKKILEGN